MDLRMNRVGAVAASILLFVVALLGASLLPTHPSGPLALFAGEAVRDQAAPGLSFDYVVTIIMENKNLCDIYTHCGGSAANMTNLADDYSISLDYRYCNINPSMPNYLCLMGGSTFGCTSNDDPHSSNCTNDAWASPNIVDRLEDAGLTWKAYMEDMPSNCYGSNSGLYVVRHNPFVYFSSIVDNTTRCNKVIPAGAADSALLTDLASTSTASNFMWLTPNNCNNMHDCSIAIGDAYLAVLVPLILGSPVFLTERAVLFVTFDEAYGNPTYAAWAGPVVKTLYTSSAYYDAYSYLRTIETNWNLPPLTSNDQNATPMNEFFTTPTAPDFSLSANPTSVSFVAGQSATSTISLQSTGGFSGTVALTATSAPAGVTTACVPSNISGSQSSTCTFSGSTAGSYTVTVTGTNGSLVHTTSIAVTVTTPSSPDFSISANPASVSFVAGQSATSTVFLQSIGGFTGIVVLAAASSPSGITTSCVPTSISGTQTSACTMSGTTPGTFSVAVTGTSGTLSHSTSIAVTVVAEGPTARFTFSPAFPRVNNSVAFDASSSSDSDPSATLQARWDWEGDGVWDTLWSSPLTAEHVFTAAGTYLVKLEILDSHGLTDTISQWTAVQNPGGGDNTPPQLAIISPPNDTVIESPNVTVTGVAWDNVAISTIELSTDNTTWVPTSGTTSWSGSVLLKAGMNHIYARATDSSGNERTAVITVTAENPDHGPAGLVPGALDPAIAVLLVVSGVVALAGVHASLSNKSRTRRTRRKKESAIVGRPEKRNRWLLAAKGLFKR